MIVGCSSHSKTAYLLLFGTIIYLLVSEIDPSAMMTVSHVTSGRRGDSNWFLLARWKRSHDCFARCSRLWLRHSWRTPCGLWDIVFVFFRHFNNGQQTRNPGILKVLQITDGMTICSSWLCHYNVSLISSDHLYIKCFLCVNNSLFFFLFFCHMSSCMVVFPCAPAVRCKGKWWANEKFNPGC